MLSKIQQAIKLLGVYLLRHPQFFFTLLLILFLPFAFLFTGQQFLKVANDNQDSLEKNKIGVLHDVFAELVRVQKDNPAELQKVIDDNAFKAQ